MTMLCLNCATLSTFQPWESQSINYIHSLIIIIIMIYPDLESTKRKWIQFQEVFQKKGVDLVKKKCYIYIYKTYGRGNTLNALETGRTIHQVATVNYNPLCFTAHGKMKKFFGWLHERGDNKKIWDGRLCTKSHQHHVKNISSQRYHYVLQSHMFSLNAEIQALKLA